MQNNKITDSLKVAIDRIPEPTATLVGRTEELTQIKTAFAGNETAIVTIVAGAGVGKSALSWEWLQQMQPDYGGAELVFGWSFYSQGSHQTATSSAPFFQAALPFFCFPGKWPHDEIEKARALAECLRKKRSVLILDGLEPLQHPAHIQDGELADVAIKELLRCVQYYGLGGQKNLVLISSRQPLVELAHWQGHQKLDLQTLAIADGVKLLQNLGCEGSLAMLQAASRDLGGHALALVLMGRLLKERFAGLIESRDQLPTWFEGEQEGGHALRVLRYYDEVYWRDAHFFKRMYQKLFGEAPERVLLQLLCLFDRPMGELERRVLFAKAKLAKPLAKLNEKELLSVVKRLEQAGLLLQSEGERREWDTHPLIRSYFGSTLRDKQPKLYRQAQLVLFEYYQSVPDKPQPETLEELEPLYRAVVHGCLAGEYIKARKEVYWERILRGDEGYSSSQLGAYSHDLTALAAFFPTGWNKPILTTSKLRTWLVKRVDLNTIEPIDSLPVFLRKRYRGLASWAFLLGEASFCLMYLGRLTEAIAPRQIDIEIRDKLKDWEEAAKSAGHLVVLYRSRGQLQEAKQVAQQALFYADKTDNLFHQMSSRTKLAAILHRQGDLATALEQFKIAEKIQAKRQSNYPWLYSLSGFQYCALLLDQATNTTARKSVLDRGQYALEISKRNNWLLGIALDYLTIARSRTSKGSKLNLFNQAVQKVRKAGSVIDIPEVLLASANFHRLQKNFKLAQLDLDESFDIIYRCGMKLYQVDALLLQANLNLDQKQPAEYKPIKNLITVTGYHLRDPELDLLAARIALYNQYRDKAQHYLQQSRQKLEKMGYWGFLSEWKKVQVKAR
jgi:hypothetical protein